MAIFTLRCTKVYMCICVNECNSMRICAMKCNEMRMCNAMQRSTYAMQCNAMRMCNAMPIYNAMHIC